METTGNLYIKKSELSIFLSVYCKHLSDFSKTSHKNNLNAVNIYL